MLHVLHEWPFQTRLDDERHPPSLGGEPLLVARKCVHEKVALWFLACAVGSKVYVLQT